MQNFKPSPSRGPTLRKGSDGEIVCRYAAADDSINMDSITFQYRQPTEDWKSIATEPVLSRRSPAHLIGEEIWWAGQEIESLTVKISVADTAGHRRTKQFSMLPTDPNVSQSDLANEIIAPAIPSPLAGSNRRTKSVVVKKTLSNTHNTALDWQPTPGNPWSAGEPVAYTLSLIHI